MYYVYHVFITYKSCNPGKKWDLIRKLLGHYTRNSRGYFYSSQEYLLAWWHANHVTSLGINCFNLTETANYLPSIYFSFHSKTVLSLEVAKYPLKIFSSLPSIWDVKRSICWVSASFVKGLLSGRHPVWLSHLPPTTCLELTYSI